MSLEESRKEFNKLQSATTGQDRVIRDTSQQLSLVDERHEKALKEIDFANKLNAELEGRIKHRDLKINNLAG